MMKFNFSRWAEGLYQYRSVGELKNIDLKSIPTGVFQFNDLSAILNFYIQDFNLTSQNNKLLVGFGGALSLRNENTEAPFFSFLNIASEAKIPLLAFSDSSLYRDDNIKLAWYTGGTHFKKQQVRIAEIIEIICSKYNLEPILCGGSGGGFACLAISTLLTIKHTCFVWNPQTSIKDYYKRFVDDYIRVCYPNFTSKSRITQFNQIEKYGIIHDVVNIPMSEKMSLLYLQNMTDEFHVKKHCLPFIDEQAFIKLDRGTTFQYKKEENKLVLGGNWGIGHVPPNLDLLLYILKLLITNKGLDDFISLNLSIED